MTRRTFLEMVARAGGSSAVYGAMTAMGLLASPATTRSTSGPFRLSGDGRGKRVLILGAGVAGLCSAYELGKAGYDCQVLEARTRVGGRCHTIRRGSVEIETDGRSQTCAFGDGDYFNPGATRIPQHHCTLDYCRELGVAIEQFGNLNEAAYLYRQRPGNPLSGQRIRLREARSDLYGYVAELLAKAVASSELDKNLSADDRQNLLHYLAVEGGLSAEMLYRGNERRGFHVWPGAADQEGTRDDPFPLSAILSSGFGSMFAFNWTIEQQSTMFQIVGGFDRFADAFARHVRTEIELGARVTEIRQTPDAVNVLYLDRLGRQQSARADFCICTIPLPVLKQIPADFSKKMSAAIAAVPYTAATKIGLQFKRRFWEEDDKIFSGISRTDQSIGQIIYPSHGFLGKTGVLVGGYNFGPEAEEFARLTPPQRIERALAEGERLHPQYRAEFQSGMSVAWSKSPFNLGAFSGYDQKLRGEHYPTLNQPDGRVYLAGEHLSWLNGWIGGALDSAQRVTQVIHDRALRSG